MVSAPATGDFRGCASAARALAASSMFGAKEMQGRRLSCVFLPVLRTRRLRHPEPVESEVSFPPRGDATFHRKSSRKVRNGDRLRTRLFAYGQTAEHPGTTHLAPAWPVPGREPLRL